MNVQVARAATSYEGRHSVMVSCVAVSRVRLVISRDRDGGGKYVDLRPGDAAAIGARMVWTAVLAALAKRGWR